MVDGIVFLLNCSTRRSPDVKSGGSGGWLKHKKTAPDGLESKAIVMYSVGTANGDYNRGITKRQLPISKSKAQIPKTTSEAAGHDCFRRLWTPARWLAADANRLILRKVGVRHPNLAPAIRGRFERACAHRPIGTNQP